MYKRGAIVLVPFPFTDLSGNKVRPAVIVSNGKIGDDVVVLFITSQAKMKGQYLIAVVPDGRTGLKAKSSIVCSKLATLETKIILGELGCISSETQRTIDKELRKVLGL